MGPITARERDVLRLIAQGRSTKQIAADLNIAFKTAVTHRYNLMAKLGATNTATLIVKATQLGLLDAETKAPEPISSARRTEMHAQVMELRVALQMSRELREEMRQARLAFTEAHEDFHVMVEELLQDHPARR